MSSQQVTFFAITILPTKDAVFLSEFNVMSLLAWENNSSLITYKNGIHLFRSEQETR